MAQTIAFLASDAASFITGQRRHDVDVAEQSRFDYLYIDYDVLLSNDVITVAGAQLPVDGGRHAMCPR